MYFGKVGYNNLLGGVRKLALACKKVPTLCPYHLLILT